LSALKFLFFYLAPIAGLLLMGVSYDRPQWYFVVAGVLGLCLFVFTPLWLLASWIRRRSK